MIKRLTTITALLAVAALAALGGSASAKSHSHHGKATRHAVVGHTGRSAASAGESTESSGVDGDNVQAGDQSSPDPQASASGEEQTGEQSSDGLGGHEDEAGTAADHQFEGEE